jgi:hypothetical protein
MRGLALVAISICAFLDVVSASAAPSCQRELGGTDIALIKAVLSLRKVDQSREDEKCIAYRQHVETVTKVREVFVRCLSGPKRDADLRQLDDALADAGGVVALVCRRSANP